MSDYTDLQKAAEYAAQDAIKFADEDEEMRALQQFHEEVDPETVLALIAESERLQGCEDVLRQLASYCGCGGYNAPEVSPEVFAKKIMDGINILNDPLMALADKRGVERDQLKAENEALRKALTDLLDLYDTDEGCRGLPQYIAGRAAMGKGGQS